MSQFLKFISNVGGRTHAQSSLPQIGLAAFGKHPGWDDHIPGIGVSTDALAQLKQTMYVSGIGGQIDAGAWEKLESNKRIEGFDHCFLASWGKHILSGQFWSSVDRKGRTKYPMFLCLDGQHIGVDFILQLNQQELTQLRQRCVGTQEQEVVQLECAASLERVITSVQNHKSAAEMGPGSKVDWEKFLAAPQLGMGQIGLLRILHEIRYAEQKTTSVIGRHKELSSSHLRVPVIIGAADEPLLPWFEFFKGLLPQGTPLCLIRRPNADWVDVILGEPSSRDLLCLQASLVAMPLVTEIPYDLDPELTKALPEVVGILTRSKTNSGELPGGGGSMAEANTPEKKSARRIWPWGVALAAVLLILILLVFLKSRSGQQAAETLDGNTNKELPATNLTTVTSRPPVIAKMRDGPENLPAVPAAVVQTPASNDTNAIFRSSLTAASIAIIQRDYPAAIKHAQIALSLSPTSKEARDIFDKATRAEEEIKSRNARDANYTNLITRARNELNTLRLDEALQSAKSALDIRPDSPVAAELLASAKREQAKIMAQREVDQKYSNSMALAKTAYDKKAYSEAIAQAQTALQIKPSDGEATRILTMAGEAVAAEQAMVMRTNNFLSAVRAGQAALQKGDITGATAQSQAAAAIDQNNPLLTELNARIKRAQDVLQARAALQQRDLTALAKWGAAYPRDPEIQAIIAQSKEDSCESLMAQAEVMMVRFGTKKAKDAQTEAARKTERIAGQLSVPDSQQNIRFVDTLKAKFKAGGCLTPELEKELNRVKDNINSL